MALPTETAKTETYEGPHNVTKPRDDAQCSPNGKRSAPSLGRPYNVPNLMIIIKLLAFILHAAITIKSQAYFYIFSTLVRIEVPCSGTPLLDPPPRRFSLVLH